MDEKEHIDLKEFNLKDSKKKVFKFINSDRFNIWKCGYKFDKWIFQFIMFGLFALMFFIAYSNNFDLNYYKCGGIVNPNFIVDKSTDCVNPFYEAADWTNEKTLPPGEYGLKPGPLFNNLEILATSLFIIGILLNHFIYNRKFFKNGGFFNGDHFKE